MPRLQSGGIAIGQIETAYLNMFGICGAAYLVGWGVMHLLAPKFERVDV